MPSMRRRESSPARRCGGGVAARGKGAAAGYAEDRVPQRRLAGVTADAELENLGTIASCRVFSAAVGH
jgi:hypothetical protein